MDFILKGDWFLENPRKKDLSFAGSVTRPAASTSEGSSLGPTCGLFRGRVPSPSPSNVAVVGAKLLPVGDPHDLVVDQAEVEPQRPRNSHDAGSPKYIEQQFKRAVEKEQKEKQRTETLGRFVGHQGNIISSLQQQLTVVAGDLTKRKSGDVSDQQRQNLPAKSSQSSSSFSTTSMDSDSRWSASAELNIQVTHRGVQCHISWDSEEDVLERLKQLSDDREALRTDVRELLQDKRFWQAKCRMVLEQMQSLEEKSKVLSTERSLMSRSCSELSKELEKLKERCAEHEHCTFLNDSSSKEIERLTNLANIISKERKVLEEQVEYLQNRMQSHLDKFSRLKDELKGAVKERDAATAQAESALQNAQLLQSERDHWKEQCNSALSELQQTLLFHEELRKVHLSSQHEVERFQDELVTLRLALRTQSGEITQREKEISVWRQRAEQLEASVDQAQERMKAGMSDLRQQLEKRDRTIQQQKQHLLKMPQIQADLVTLRTELKRTIAAVSESCGSSPNVERKSSVSGSPVPTEMVSLRDSPPCSCHIKFERTDSSTSTSENPVPRLADSSTSTSDSPVDLTDSSTSTSEMPVCFADSSTSTFENPIFTTDCTSTSEAVDVSEAEVDFDFDELFNPNVSLLDVSVERLGQLLKGAGDSRVKHIETQTDLTRESTVVESDRGDTAVENLKIKLSEIAEESLQLVSERESRVLAEDRLKFEVDCRKSFEDNLESEKIRLKESASVSAAVLAETLGRVYDDVKSKEAGEFEVLKEERDRLHLECKDVTSERDVLEILLEKETSARLTKSERLLEAESKILSLAGDVKNVSERLETREAEFHEKMAEVRWKLEAEMEKSRNLAGIEEELNKERAQTALLEKKIVSSGNVLSEMIILSKFFHSAFSGETKKYEQAVQAFKVVTLCLRKELWRQVRRIDGVNRAVDAGNKYIRKFFLVRGRVPLKRLFKSAVGRSHAKTACPKRRNIAKILRRRVRQAIWHSVVFQEGTNLESGKAVKVARRGKKRRNFETVFSELKKNVARLKYVRDKAVEVMDERASRVAELEGENEELRKDKGLLEQKLAAEQQRGSAKIRALVEELTAARESNLQIKHQMKVLANCRADSEAKLFGFTEVKLDEKKKGTTPLQDEITRIRGDLEKERNRTVGARKEAAEFNNWFHVLEDYVRNQPANFSNPDQVSDSSDSKEAAFHETPRQRGGVTSKEAFVSCPHQDGTGCCPGSNPSHLECPLCFLKTQEVNGSNSGWASRAVHLAHECARKLNQQALSHQANLASVKAAHQRDLAALRNAHSTALLRLQSKQNAEIARVRREIRAELKASLRTEVRANINAVVERSLAEVEHLHRAEMRKLTRSLSSPMKFRLCRPCEIGQQEAGHHADLRNQTKLPLRQEFDPLHDHRIVLFPPDPSCDELHDAGLLNWDGGNFGRKSFQPQNIENGFAEERERLWLLGRELQAEKEEASRLLMVLGGQCVALRTGQACLRAWTDVDTKSTQQVC